MQPKNLNFLQVMKTTPNYEYHFFANMFPLISDAEIDELAENIKVNGLTSPIVIYQGEILDGRNRYIACQKAGVTPDFWEYTGDTPIQFAISMNLHRRHLNTQQRAEIADNIATLPQGARTDLASFEAFSQTEAAELMGVSRSSVQRARAERLRRAKPEQPSKEVDESNSSSNENAAGDGEAASNGKAAIKKKRSKPISDNEQIIKRFNIFVTDLAADLNIRPEIVRAVIWQFSDDAPSV
jgi:ParB-like chromosome segregation protein Spo0J